MVLKIRLARVAGPGGSKRHAPFYNIVLAQARSARDSRPMEVLGTYDPIPKLPVEAPEGARKQKDIKIDVSRAKYWLGVGAQPTDTAWRLLAMIGLVEPKWLANGEQTTDALKQVRFKTHIPMKGGIVELLKPYKTSQYSRTIRRGRKQETGSTKPAKQKTKSTKPAEQKIKSIKPAEQKTKSIKPAFMRLSLHSNQEPNTA